MTIREIKGFTPKDEYAITMIDESEIELHRERPSFVGTAQYASLKPEENEIGSIVDAIKTEFDGGFSAKVANIKERIFINAKETQI